MGTYTGDSTVCEFAKRMRDGEVASFIIPCEKCGKHFKWSDARAHRGAYPFYCDCTAHRFMYPAKRENMDEIAENVIDIHSQCA